MKIITIILCLSLLLPALSGWAITEEQWDEVKLMKLRKELIQIVEKEDRVEVKLKTKTKVRGYVQNIEQDRFTLCNQQGATIIEFQDISKIKGYRLDAGQKWLIGVAAGWGLFFLLVKIFVPYT